MHQRCACSRLQGLPRTNSLHHAACQSMAARRHGNAPVGRQARRGAGPGNCAHCRQRRRRGLRGGGAHPHCRGRCGERAPNRPGHPDGQGASWRGIAAAPPIIPRERPPAARFAARACMRVCCTGFSWMSTSRAATAVEQDTSCSPAESTIVIPACGARKEGGGRQHRRSRNRNSARVRAWRRSSRLPSRLHFSLVCR